jgi:DNA polymerase
VAQSLLDERKVQELKIAEIYKWRKAQAVSVHARVRKCVAGSTRSTEPPAAAAHATSVFGEGPVTPESCSSASRPATSKTGSAWDRPDKALEQISIDKRELYITNVIKHFKFELCGKQRLHKRERGKSKRACAGSTRNLSEQKPQYLVCLGALATKLFPRVLVQAAAARRMDQARRWALGIGDSAFVMRPPQPHSVRDTKRPMQDSSMIRVRCSFCRNSCNSQL